MADPTKYERDYGFANYQASQPNKPLPGAEVDIELDNIADAISGAVDAIKDIRRSDGALQNGIVTLDSLADEIRIDVAADADRAEAAAEQAAALGTIYTQTDAQMALLTIPDGAVIIQRLPSATGQVAPANILTWWRRNSSPSSDPYFTTAGGATWTQTALREQDVLSTLQTAISALGTTGFRSLADRAAVVAWIAGNAMPPIGTVLRWPGAAVRYTGSGAIIADMPGWVPEGSPSPLHYGMQSGTTTPIQTANVAAFVACVTNHDDVIIPAGNWYFNGILDLVDLPAKRIICPDGRANLVFTAVNANGVRVRLSDTATTAFANAVRFDYISILSVNATNTTGIGLDLVNTNGSRFLNGTVQGFWRCYAVRGGQNNRFGMVGGFGRGAVASNTDESCIFWAAHYITSGGTIVPQYTCAIDGYNFSGNNNGVSPNTHDIFRLEAGDDFTASHGYFNHAARSLVYMRITEAYNTAQINFNGGYADATRGSVITTPHNLYVDAATSTGRINRVVFTGGFGFANANSDAIVAVAGNRLKRLILNGSVIGGAGGKLANIVGSLGVDGLFLQADGVQFFRTLGGFYVDTAESVSLVGTLIEITDAAGPVQLSGTIRQKRISASLTNCVGAIVDTSTGNIGGVHYEWYEEGLFTPSLRIGTTLVSGASHSLQYGEYTRIRNEVTVRGGVDITSKDALTGTVEIAGLPSVRAGGINPDISVRCGNNTSLALGVTLASGDMAAATARVRLRKSVSGGAIAMTDVDILATCSLRFQGTYRI